MSGFQKFILRGNVVDLAVGIIIGAAFANVINALVKDIITPFIGIFGKLPDFSAWTVTINGSKFMIGDFINALVSFLIMALVVYFFIVKPVNALMDRYKGEQPPAPPATRDCPYCLSKIPRDAKKCAFCTADVQPVRAK